jgi:hypothetical protein
VRLHPARSVHRIPEQREPATEEWRDLRFYSCSVHLLFTTSDLFGTVLYPVAGGRKSKQLFEKVRESGRCDSLGVSGANDAGGDGPARDADADRDAASARIFLVDKRRCGGLNRKSRLSACGCQQRKLAGPAIAAASILWALS